MFGAMQSRGGRRGSQLIMQVGLSNQGVISGRGRLRTGEVAGPLDAGVCQLGRARAGDGLLQVGR